jgi:hypothetical protein
MIAGASASVFALFVAVVTAGTVPRSPSPASVTTGDDPSRHDGMDFAGAESRLRSAAAQAGVAWPLPDPRLHVYKGQRTVELRSGEAVVRSYRVALGNEPDIDKEREGDHRTPVGEFYVCTRNDRSNFHLFLGVSYPSREDAERGLRSGLVNRRQYDAIIQANTLGVRPPWDTGLGGFVGIHGGGSRGDWTWGCIALENADIEELWLACPLKTPITIER